MSTMKLVTISCLLAAAIVLTGTDCGNSLEIQSITSGEAQLDPRWTGDGSSVVFGFSYVPQGIRPVGGRYHGIFVVNTEGSMLSRWVPQGSPQDEEFAIDFAPDLEPNSSRVVFSTLRNGLDGDRDLEIATANLDGSGYRRLTDSVRSDSSPAWSPDGSRIAFLSEREHSGVYLMDADGSNQRLLHPETSAARDLVWSPEGDYIAFRDGLRLYAASTHDRPSPQLRYHLGMSRTAPAWSPDGQWIAFSIMEPVPETVETETLYIARPDLSEVHNLRRFENPSGKPPSLNNLSWGPELGVIRFTMYDDNDGHALRQIITNGEDYGPIVDIEPEAQIAWSPDYSRAAVSLTQRKFGSSRDKFTAGTVLLYSIAADGSDRRPLVRMGWDWPEAANKQRVGDRVTMPQTADPTEPGF